ncbi:bifunctional 3-(3-hydroxy-phenyl)propionate/3-hydroxycinnamic acid hydroxylase [Marinobacterium sp. D7]|uniref:bifunctional 3-(3-hydroxy-phenyl)propionate/3-hydroxycinnamic acid hydroxylase n=1 Tax=Marinobacterium ramblicola TaxID=2849041 RepID=UPI001C2D2324|nr:bifunctional 3-(3-hydroxy-phenyl)propionate/3-hydroxycinnamic acid hydroxylase [Marinobacterium ramblicola]MBV1788703.1 bifunctional 3-(3-hydroxy-phenyl)propionate/3-hydroxycinnamic acid hydroxylase [Marinobacterium ramblicola]
MGAEQYDVAIVGFGPSGAVAASLLGRAGFRVHVCDRLHEVYDKPRAIALDHEILRVFQQLGVVEQVEPYYEPFTDSCFYGVDGQLIRRMTMLPEPYPQGFVPSVVFTQPPVEEVLRKAVLALPTVTVETGLTLTSLHQTDADVTLELAAEDGSSRSISARYVIGCDGASSTVRDLVGIRLEDLAFDEPWLVVDVLANDKGLAKLPSTSVQYCDPERPATFVIGPGNHRRWEISLKESEDPKTVATPEGTWRLLERWITPEDAELWRQASYRFHALVAERWRDGRVFIAGDASHQQPPFLGQGMCQGVRDVTNLAWKLSAVLIGEIQDPAAQALLDSYGIERKEHVRQLTGKLKEIGAVICERDVEKARKRDAELLAQAGGKIQPTPRQDVLPPLSTGLITHTPGAGTLFPQPWMLRDGQRIRLDDLAGNGWRLVMASGFEAPLLSDLAGVLNLTGIVLGTPDYEEADQVVAQWFAQHNARAALVRPDNYVYGSAQDVDDLGRLQRELLDRLT